jgi:RNA polymerase sigma factor (sigma-70 family)
MIMNSMMTRDGAADADLVSLCLDGDRDAFGHIVTRYQSLVCSLAYSATGSLGQSQDLAQETFITAWKHLRLLRERHKLRPWLCGIARCLIGKALRRDGREPAHESEPLDLLQESAAEDPLPSERLITKEEEAILWRSIERIPAIYREPLVLFYREHQSVEHVAAALDLTEDTVKQRLSRGRKLLRDEVLDFVEGALARTSPGKAFTFAVLAALPIGASSASAATLGASIANSTAATKMAAWLLPLNALAGPVIGFTAAYLGYKSSMEGAASEKERTFIKKFFGLLTVFIVVPLALVMLGVFLRPQAVSHPSLFAGLMIGTVTSWIPATALLIIWTRRKVRELNADSTATSPGVSASQTATAFEYRSHACLFGLPLIHVRLGGTWASQRGPVKAWIALADDAAIGVIFAFGGMAIAPISIGGFALGGIVFGGFGAGILCYAGFAVGAWVVGGIVSGLMAVGGCAFGWKAALGGIAIAHDLAQGGLALAPHANDTAASSFISGSAFFRNAFLLVTKWLWPMLLVSLIPSILISRAARKKRRQLA